MPSERHRQGVSEQWGRLAVCLGSLRGQWAGMLGHRGWQVKNLPHGRARGRWFCGPEAAPHETLIILGYAPPGRETAVAAPKRWPPATRPWP